MRQHELKRALLLSPALMRLGDALCDQLAAIAEPVAFQAGENIIEQGKEGDALYFIIEGEAGVTGLSSTVVLRPGELFGEMSTLFDIPRGAGIDALSDIKLAKFPSAPLAPLLEKHEALVNVLLELDVLRSD